MNTRLTLAALLALAATGAVTSTAIAKPPLHPAIHSYILLDRTG